MGCLLLLVLPVLACASSDGLAAHTSRWPTLDPRSKAHNTALPALARLGLLVLGRAAAADAALALAFARVATCMAAIGVLVTL